MKKLALIILLSMASIMASAAIVATKNIDYGDGFSYTVVLSDRAVGDFAGCDAHPSSKMVQIYERPEGQRERMLMAGCWWMIKGDRVQVRGLTFSEKKLFVDQFDAKKFKSSINWRAKGQPSNF